MHILNFEDKDIKIDASDSLNYIDSHLLYLLRYKSEIMRVSYILNNGSKYINHKDIAYFKYNIKRVNPNNLLYEELDIYHKLKENIDLVTKDITKKEAKWNDTSQFYFVYSKFYELKNKIECPKKKKLLDFTFCSFTIIDRNKLNDKSKKDYDRLFDQIIKIV